jgi:hypothetical protein
MCSECDSVWLSPNIINEESVIYPKSPNFVVDEIGCSIAVPLSKWAERKDVEVKGWGKYIFGEGNP